MAIDISDELRGKLRRATAEEVEAILAEAGLQATEEEIERIKFEIKRAAEHDGEQLSLDELDAVAGGAWSKDYTKDGCVATVEYKSDCWGEDGGCIAVHYCYSGKPVNVRCTRCGNRYMYKSHYIQYGNQEKIGVLACPYCGMERQVELSLWDALVPG